MLGDSARPWRVRLYAPEDGGTKYQVMFRAPAGEDEPWKRVLRRANSEEKARKIFAQIRVAGFGGLRLGEQNTLRAIDVFFEHGYVHVNVAWITPRKADGFRGPVKNHSIHEVPPPKSLMRDEILPRVKELLGLSAKASLQQVVNAQEEE